MKHLYLFVLIIFLLGCSDSSSNEYDDSSESTSDSPGSGSYGIDDGVYCARVDYYNPNTGTESTYTLEIEIKNNRLAVIHWPNGGWLDNTHFNEPDISDGSASFDTYEGVSYKVYDIKNQGSCTLSFSAPNESMYDSDEEDEHTCDRCGSTMFFSYETYCDNCKDEIENTCSRCGLYEYGVYGGVCSSCKRRLEEDGFEDF